jgi:putative transposase
MPADTPPPLSTRRRLRLPGYDYSSPGAYFVTICTYCRRWLFSRIETGTIRLSTLGRIVVAEWQRTGTVHRGLSLDAFVVMPDHFHAVVLLDGEVRDLPPLGVVINRFKAAVTRRARRLDNGTSEVWQRGYYEHIIRNDQDLQAIREYIQANPERWSDEKDSLPRRF